MPIMEFLPKERLHLEDCARVRLVIEQNFKLTHVVVFAGQPSPPAT